jgi:signal transduction histidine kinase
MTVRRRIVVLLLVVSLVPLAVANWIWLLSSQSALKDAAAGHQQLLVKSAADAVGYFIDDKVDAAIIHSQTAGVQNMQLPVAQTELTSYLKQDSDIAQIQLVDSAGQQRILVNSAGASTQTADLSKSDAFRVVTFLSGGDYISPVSFDSRHEGHITLAVPIISFTTSQSGNYLTTSQPSVVLAPSSIKGALILDVALQGLWNKVLSNRLGQSGYAYVVDGQGNLVAYPHAGFAANHPSLAQVAEVKTALSEDQTPGATDPEPQARETTSEKGTRVLSSHYRVDRAGWIVVAEEPIDSVYAPVINDLRVAGTFFAVSAMLGLVLVLLTAHSLLAPIRALIEGANRFGKGDLGHRIELARRDEFGMLAQTFNSMAAKISADITKLRDVDDMKNEFISLASHNLRTPLTVINGYIELMKDMRVSAETKEMMKAIEESARDLSGFSEDMMTISTIRSGNGEVDHSQITIERLLGPVRANFDAQAAKKGVLLEWRLPDPQTTLNLSTGQIRSALSNLIKNALEFTPEKGRIEVAVDVRPEGYTFSISDTGAGIQKEEMDRLFTGFHRATDTLRYEHGGAGIGLYLTLLVVEAHRGQITVRSQPGQGSTFTIVLPAGNA